MTSLEQHFFDTFEIKEYPTITDTHYLELICIINKFDTNVDYFNKYDYKTLKETILDDCLNFVCKLNAVAFNELTRQIQAIFKN